MMSQRTIIIALVIIVALGYGWAFWYIHGFPPGRGR